MGYQDFDGKGGSKSHDKLQALRLDDFAFVTKRNRAMPLAGLSLLDIGCNEGFFCIEAVKQGATRVVGVDFNADVITSAKKRCPQAEFIKATWWDLPNEQFDVILFLSAIHYEPDQKRLLGEIRRRLKPDGVLILECGVASDQGFKSWHTVKRWDAVRRYPTHAMLVEELLADFAVRPVGRSVMQDGDPIPRYVFHCRAKKSTALIISGDSGDGKSGLATLFEAKGVPTFETDLMLMRVLIDNRYSWRPLANALRAKYPMKGLNLAAVAIHIEATPELRNEFCELVAAECPKEAELFCLVGDALKHPLINQGITKRLGKANVRAWNVARVHGEPVVSPAIPS